MIPELSPMGGLIVWPQYDSDTIKEDTEKELSNYTKRIIEEENLAATNEPSIIYSCEFGLVKDVMHKLYEKNKIDLLIMGMSGNGELKRIFMGSNSRDLIEQTNVPILLIPKKATFKILKK